MADPTTPRSRSRWAAAVVVLGISLLTGLAATSGYGRVAGFLPRTAPRGRYATFTPPPLGSSSGRPRSEPFEMPQWVPNVAYSLLLGLGIVLVSWLIWRVLQLVQRGRRPLAKAAGQQIAVPTLDEAEVEEQLRASIDELRLGGSVDDAIIACWRRLEDLAAASGIERRPSQTSTEYTVDLLAQTRADPSDLTQLAGLYRRAMFDRQAPDEGARDEAIGCLERLSAALASPKEPTTPKEPADA